MRFRVSIKEGYKVLTFTVEQFNVTQRSEQFKVIARNKTVVLESNRPLFRNKGIKHRRPDWKLVEGTLGYQSGFERLTDAIMEVIEPPLKDK